MRYERTRNTLERDKSVSFRLPAKTVDYLIYISNIHYMGKKSKYIRDLIDEDIRKRLKKKLGPNNLVDFIRSESELHRAFNEIMG